MQQTKTETKKIRFSLVKAYKKYTLYIGSNNETKILNVPYALDIISVYYKSFTYSKVLGYWRGDTEDTLRVEIATTDPEQNIKMLCSELKQLLKQQAIMLTISNDLISFE